jgi:hypothetical protein
METYLRLDQEGLDVFKKLNNKHTPAQEMIDSFLSYKFNRYKTKLESTVKRIKGEMVLESELITTDLLDSQVLINSLSEKVIE